MQFKPVAPSIFSCVGSRQRCPRWMQLWNRGWVGYANTYGNTRSHTHAHTHTQASRAGWGELTHVCPHSDHTVRLNESEQNWNNDELSIMLVFLSLSSSFVVVHMFAFLALSLHTHEHTRTRTPLRFVASRFNQSEVDLQIWSGQYHAPIWALVFLTVTWKQKRNMSCCNRDIICSLLSGTCRRFTRQADPSLYLLHFMCVRHSLQLLHLINHSLRTLLSLP